MGDLKLLNIKMYIKGLKLSWIRRIIKKDLKITKLLLSSEKIDIIQLLNSGHKKQLNILFGKKFSMHGDYCN
jgi:hypothetical protein